MDTDKKAIHDRSILKGRPKKVYNVLDTSLTTFYCQICSNETEAIDAIYVKDEDNRLLKICRNHEELVKTKLTILK